ncbi:hypothetical protein DH2020_012680 [Rehmannia glutinosa]|uniref:RNA ligase/cyclic nucleotide phosphodiesterase n=1 Tax=Rehmannia glutinosa TaxID=99300 RepID=A0ABR0X1G5_REHGL
MSQGYAIELYFDPALENQVLKAWNVLARRQISTQLIEIESRPHITLFSTLLVDTAKLEKGIEIGEDYRPDKWIPYCAVADEVAKSRLAEAFTVLRDLKMPVSGYAMEISLVEYSPVRELVSFALGTHHVSEV